MIKVATILIFMAVAIWAIITQAHVADYTAGVHNISESGGWFPEGLAPVFALTLGVVFAFGGTEMVGVAAGEAKDAAKILPKAINSMVIRIFFFYVGSVVLFALALPYNAYSSNESPFTTFFSGIGVPHAGDIMQVVVLTAALSSLNAGLYATGRTLRSMALVGEARVSRPASTSTTCPTAASSSPRRSVCWAFCSTPSFHRTLSTSSWTWRASASLAPGR